MKKSMIFVGLLAVGFANAQTAEELKGRVGINTQTPKASLDITRHTGIPTQNPQGLILPHLSTEQRDEFERDKLTHGLMIYNTTKNCIDWWNGSKWTCTDGTQADTPLPQTTPIKLPEIEIGNSMYFFSSIYDDDYLSNATSTPTLATPTAPASLAVQAADGIADGGTHEPILNVQGKIPTKANALEVAIPIKKIHYTAFLPAFTTYLKIPAQYTKNNQEAIATLSWEEISVNDTTHNPPHSYFTAKIYAENGEIELKQLDLVAGLGSDHKGIFMGSFKYPRNKSESEGPKANWTGQYDLRLISGIPDRHFNKLTNIGTDGSKYRHRFIYAPAYIGNMDVGHTGQIWLNNNLGADYAKVGHTAFNPSQQGKTYDDHLAYGSLGLFGVEYDGHELMTWTDGTLRYDDSFTINKPTYPNNFSYTYAQQDQVPIEQFYDNCPSGWHTPLQDEAQKLADLKIYSVGSSNITKANTTQIKFGGLHFVSAGARKRYSFDQSSVGSFGLLHFIPIGMTGQNVGIIRAYLPPKPPSINNAWIGELRSGNYGNYGRSTRCIKD